MTTSTITTRAATKLDLSAVLALLAEAKLPPDGAELWIDHFIVAERDGDVVGCAGLELYGDDALLRSVATAPSVRGTGLGAQLVERAADHARAMRIADLYLLTTSAESWFTRLGFDRVPRESVPASVRQSVQFSLVTCSSATAMRRSLA
ncbi:MAG: GNAT family N-acetyltransferase [Gemmatimonadetes bacterium]|nr:GNAT family N-acetyltransferase [Gemmatimonadota bacterium]MBI3567108.1 GNAT family N-acetyltransferase [Gemmatimonadota bacterium]